MKIEELMSHPARSCRLSDTLEDAAAQMWEFDCGALPVVGDDGILLGMITDRDVSLAAYTRGLSLRDIPVESAMAKEIFHCRPDETIEAAERLMAEKRIRRVPVVDEKGRPIGLLSVEDLARNAARSPANGDLDRRVVQTLAAIGEPRAERTESDPPERATARDLHAR
jgi:CBS domain-containing protein